MTNVNTNNEQLPGILNRLVLPLILMAWVASPCGGQEAEQASTRLPDLWTAAKRGSLEEINDALASGAKINAQDTNGITPLCWTAMAGHKDATAALVEAGADVNGRNGDGATPLIAAAFLGRTKVIETLLENGAKIDVINDEGNGPLAVMEIHWETTAAKARALGIDADKYQVQQGRKKSAEVLREFGAVEESGSPIGLAVLAVLAGVVTWLTYRAKKKMNKSNPKNT